MGQKHKTLIALSPNKAVVVREGRELEIKPEEIKVGDTVKITSGEKILLMDLL